MPALAKTSDATVIDAARKIVERQGLDGLSMQSVAAAVHVTPPALYKRYADRAALVRAVQRKGFDALARALTTIAKPSDRRAKIAMLASAYRAFAKANPKLYDAMFHDVHPLEAIDIEARRSAATPLLELLKHLEPEAHRLKLARTFTAFVHGFVQMETSGAFNLGGDVNEAFSYGIDLLLRVADPELTPRARRPHSARKQNS